MLHKLVSSLYYKSKPVWRIYRTLEQTQYLSSQKLRHIQFVKLQKLLKNALNCSPFTRDRFAKNSISLREIQSLEDLQRLPITEKHHLKIITVQDELNTKKLVTKRTGGSTGEPVTVYCTKDHVYWSMAAMLRFYSWIGSKLGERRAKLFAAPTRTGVPENTLSNHTRNWLGNTLFMDATQLTPERVEQVISALKRFRPKLLLGYTSCMTTLANSLLSSNRRLALPDLKIVNAAEPIDSSKRVLIESSFGGNLYDHYGTREIGYIADECEFRNGLHVHMEYLILEIVDQQGRWVKNGQEGEILITGLENFGMPLLRYRIGDRAVKTDEPCPCGRGLEIVSSITGRNTDTIILPNGNKLTGLIFPHALKDFQIIEYQIRQKSIGTIQVKVVLEPTAPEDTLRNIHSALKQIMPGTTIKLLLVNEIPRTESGKLRSVVSELSGPMS